MEFRNLKNHNWVVKHPRKNIYIMVDHKWAFVVWEYAKIKKIIREKACLVHVDTHLDDVPELVDNQKVLSANSIDDLFEIAHYKRDPDGDDFQELELREDNFLIPSFLRGTIQDIVYVSNSENQSEVNTKEFTVRDIYESVKDEESNNYFDYSGGVDRFSLSKCYELIKGHNKSIERFIGAEAFLRESWPFHKDQSKILDLDLDYFNNSTQLFSAELKGEGDIRSVLLGLKTYTDWDLITVALSPDYCGESKDCMYLLELFLEIFELDFTDFKLWSASNYDS
ncbi:hypothetical protein JCM19047_363 [Bacillus sp. JCM 19047]|nr:hypothetical protein JCM19047_363 [Bacillus sp. JCM 19047]